MVIYFRTEQRALDRTEDELRALRKNLLQEAQTGELVLVIDGQSIKADPNSTKTSNHLDCPRGMSQDHDAICCGEFVCFVLVFFCLFVFFCGGKSRFLWSHWYSLFRTSVDSDHVF